MIRCQRVVWVLVLIALCAFPLGVSAAEIKTLTVEEAVSIALERNIDLKIAALNLANSRLEHQKSKATNLMNQSKYVELEAEYNLFNAEESYQQAYDKIITTTLQQYSNVVLSKMSIESKEKSVKLEEQLLEEVRKQVELGDKGSLDLIQQENKFRATIFNLEKAQSAYQQNLIAMQLTLGIAEEELELSLLDFPTIWEIEEETVLATAIENSIDIQLKEKRLELAQLNLERGEVTSTSELDKQILTNKLEIARLEVARAKEDLNNSIQKSYDDFKQAVTTLELEEENLLEVRENYRIIKEQKESGLKTAKDLLQAEISVINQEYQYYTAIFSYYQKELSLKQAIGIEIGVFSNETNQ